MKIYLYLFLFSSFALAEPLDISSIKYDLRESLITRVQIASGVTDGYCFIDSSRLIRSDRLKEKFAPNLFALNSEKISNGTALSNVLAGYLEQNDKSLGSFFKRSSTVIKVFKKTEIHLFVAYEALTSELEIDAGDIIVMQELGCII